MDFTDFFYMLIFAKLRFIFLSECFFTNLKDYYKQSRFFGPNHIGPKTIISWILQTSKFKSTTESVWGGTRLIHFDVLCKYLYLLLSQLGHRTNKFTETAPDLFIKNHLKGTICGFMPPRKHLLLILILTYNLPFNIPKNSTWLNIQEYFITEFNFVTNKYGNCSRFSPEINDCIWLIPPSIRTPFLSIMSHTQKSPPVVFYMKKVVLGNFT